MFGVKAVKLPFSFDARRLQADLSNIQTYEWINHYRGEHYEGEWSVAPLRSVAGHPAVIHVVPGGGVGENPYRDTPILERCAYFKEIIQRFKCQVNAARLMLLGPGARILEHTDKMDAEEFQEVRLHIPVKTNPQVQFFVNGQLISMQPGETWYADFNLPHSVTNAGTDDRIHLVLDCVRNEWLEEWIKKAAEVSGIFDFLNQIGIETKSESLEDDTFLPGIKIHNGTILVDFEKLKFHGDILHEAGHIAITPAVERSRMNGNVGKENPNALGDEIAAILWSYAALHAIGLPEEVVFHENGYKGQSRWFIEQFRNQHNFIGLNLLEWMGMAAGEERAKQTGALPFPHMMNWLRD